MVCWLRVDGLHHVLNPDGQPVLSLSGGVEDRVCDSGCRADHRDLAEALHPDVVEEQVGLVDEVEVDLLYVSVDQDGYSSSVVLRNPPKRGSTSLDSRSASLMPQITPPRT